MIGVQMAHALEHLCYVVDRFRLAQVLLVEDMIEQFAAVHPARIQNFKIYISLNNVSTPIFQCE